MPNHVVGDEDGKRQILKVPGDRVDGTSCLDYASSWGGKSTEQLLVSQVWRLGKYGAKSKMHEQGSK